MDCIKLFQLYYICSLLLQNIRPKMEDFKQYHPFKAWQDDRPFTFDRFVRLLLSIATIVGIVLIIRSISNVLVPFFIALLLAYLADPLVALFQNRLRIKHRGLAVFITLFLFLALLSGALWWLIPQFLTELAKLGSLVRIYLQSHSYQDFIPENVDLWLRNFLVSKRVQDLLNAENLNQAGEVLLRSAKSVFNNSINILAGAAGFLLIMLYLFFILLDYKKLETGWQSLLSEKHRPLAISISNDLKKAMRVYFRAQTTIAFTVGVLLAIGFSLIKLPMAVTLGLFIGLLNIVPYLQVVGFIPALFLALLKAMETDQSFGQIVLLVLLVMAVVQIIQETLLIPKIMGKAYNMNPAIILLSLSVWGSLMGVLGMLLALPLTTLIFSYYRLLILGESKMPVLQQKEQENQVTPDSDKE